MKYILLAISLLVPQAFVASSRPLSAAAKTDIATATIFGSMLGLACSAVMQGQRDHITSEQVMGMGCGAAIGALCGYFFNADKRFEKNIDYHWEQACKRWENCKNDELICQIYRLYWLKKKAILNLESWYFPKYHDALYTSYPLLSAHTCLVRKHAELKELQTLFDKIADFSYESACPLILNHNNHEQLCQYLHVLKKAIEVIEACPEYHRQYRHYQDSLPKYTYRPVHHATVHKPIYVYQPAPVVVYPPVVLPKTPTVPSTPSQPATTTTISPTLHGDVYGTIWSNY